MAIFFYIKNNNPLYSISRKIQGDFSLQQNSSGTCPLITVLIRNLFPAWRGDGWVPHRSNSNLMWLSPWPESMAFDWHPLPRLCVGVGGRGRGMQAASCIGSRAVMMKLRLAAHCALCTSSTSPCAVDLT